MLLVQEDGHILLHFVKKMHCIDPSNSINIAKKFKKFNGFKFYKQTILKMELSTNSMDFGFSLGVLHHILMFNLISIIV